MNRDTSLLTGNKAILEETRAYDPETYEESEEVCLYDLSVYSSPLLAAQSEISYWFQQKRYSKALRPKEVRMEFTIKPESKVHATDADKKNNENSAEAKLKKSIQVGYWIKL